MENLNIMHQALCILERCIAQLGESEHYVDMRQSYLDLKTYLDILTTQKTVSKSWQIPLSLSLVVSEK